MEHDYSLWWRGAPRASPNHGQFFQLLVLEHWGSIDLQFAKPYSGPIEPQCYLLNSPIITEAITGLNKQKKSATFPKNYLLR